VSSGGQVANISKVSHIYGGGRGLGRDIPVEEARGDPGYGDAGGPARYFKQVQEQPTMSMPEDLIDYLTKMIGTPTMQGLYMSRIDDETLRGWKNNSIPGLLVEGRPTAAQAQELMRVLMPGAHLLLVAPDEEPTGHTGACTIEDAGFEIRDAILWAREGGKAHYVPKSNRKEREAGCENLKGKAGHEAVERKADTAGLNNPRAGAGRTAGHVKNFHPCLHPDALVMTEQGFRPISELGVGSMVYSADGQFHMVEHVSRHPYTSEHLYEIFVQGTNYTTLASDNHPFLIWRPARKGNAIVGGEALWLEAQEVRKGDYTMTPVFPEPDGESIDLRITRENVAQGSNLSELMFLFGLWLAEGVAHRAGHGSNVYPSFTLNLNETDLIGRIETFFSGRGVNVGVYPKAEGASVQVVAFDPRVGAEFVRLGGSGASTKRLHRAVFEFPGDLRKQILDGWLAGDGGRVRTWRQGKTVSPDLASQLRLLGEAAGYKANMHWFDAEPGEIQGRQFKETLPHIQLRFYERDMVENGRKPARPVRLIHDGVEYRLCYVQAVVEVPYEGEVVNLSVQGSPTFQTAVGMSHNTVKPKELMKRLLSDVPTTAGPVLDPFMGSGSTGVACLETKHDFVGIEMGEEYLEIADARIRHWNQVGNKGAFGAHDAPNATIVSDHEPLPEEFEPSAEDTIYILFGGGDE